MKVYDEEFAQKVYRTLSKYATMMKHSLSNLSCIYLLDSQTFEDKINCLKEGDHEGYRTIFLEGIIQNW